MKLRSSDRYLVTKSGPGFSNHFIWDPSEPFQIKNQKKWFLVHEENVVHLVDPQDSKRSLTGPVQIENLTVQVKKLPQLKPIYYSTTSEPGKGIFVYELLGKWVTESHEMGNHYAGKIGDESVFSLKIANDTVTISPKLDKLKLLDAQGTVVAQGNSTDWSFPFSQLFEVTISANQYKWRFGQAPSKGILGLPRDAIKIDREAVSFWLAMLMVGFLTTGVFIFGHKLFPPIPEATKKPREVTKILIQKAEPAKPEVKPEPPKVVEAKKPEVKPEPVAKKKPTPPEVKTAMPKPKAEPQKPAAPVAMAPVPAPKVNAPAAPAGNTAAKSAMMNQFQKLQSLAAMTGQGSKLAATQPRAPASGALATTNNANSALAPTSISPGVAFDSVNVGKVGGGAAGTNYGQAGGLAAAASKAGQAGGFVSLGGEAAAVEEGLTREEVAAVIQAHMAEVRYCFDAASLRTPNLAGTVVTQFVVGKNGDIQSSTLKSTTANNPTLERCLITKLANWKFPKPKGGVNVTIAYPFTFKTLKL